ncbi:peptide deformylase [candidate division KSB1 bacterium]|nr:peptide deformylase [candidate division KSB1 bacterium]
MLDILKIGHPVLRERTKRVKRIDRGIKILAKRMIEAMGEAGGIGLAAPQVGQSIRLIIVDHSYIEKGAGPKAYVNPEILKAEGEAVMDEGCLCIPGVRGKVVRSEKITLKCQNLEGEEQVITCDDLLARVFQHEVDHLKGILFVDRIQIPDKQITEGRIPDPSLLRPIPSKAL